jgi:LemA protein
MNPGIIPLAIVVLLVLWFALLYNALTRGVNRCSESWADIDTELKRRYDLIPNLVTAVQAYAKHEKEVLERVTQARTVAMANHGSPESQASDENELIRSLRQLFALAESYPDLKASQNFLALQTELTNTEDRIQRSRRFYNANVRDYNNRVEVFPSNFVAGAFGFSKREFFEIENVVQREAPATTSA